MSATQAVILTIWVRRLVNRRGLEGMPYLITTTQPMPDVDPHQRSGARRRRAPVDRQVPAMATIGLFKGFPPVEP